MSTVSQLTMKLKQYIPALQACFDTGGDRVDT